MLIKLKGSKGTSLEMTETAWADALTKAQQHGWKQNGSLLGENTIRAADATKLAQW